MFNAATIAIGGLVFFLSCPLHARTFLNIGGIGDTKSKEETDTGKRVLSNKQLNFLLGIEKVYTPFKYLNYSSELLLTHQKLNTASNSTNSSTFKNSSVALKTIDIGPGSSAFSIIYYTSHWESRDPLPRSINLIFSIILAPFSVIGKWTTPIPKMTMPFTMELSFEEE